MKGILVIELDLDDDPEVAGKQIAKVAQHFRANRTGEVVNLMEEVVCAIDSHAEVILDYLRGGKKDD